MRVFNLFSLIFIVYLIFFLSCFPPKKVSFSKETHFMDFVDFWIKYGLIKDRKEVLNSTLRAILTDENKKPVPYALLLLIYSDHIDSLKADSEGKIIFEGKQEYLDKNPILYAEKDGKRLGIFLKVIEMKEINKLFEEKEEFHFKDLFLLPFFRDRKPEELINLPLRVIIIDKEENPVPFAYLFFKYPDKTDTLKANEFGEITFLINSEHLTKNPMLLPAKEGFISLSMRFNLYYELSPKTQVYFTDLLKEFIQLKAITQPEELINETLEVSIIDKNGKKVPDTYLILQYPDRIDSLKSDKNGKVKILVTSENINKNPLLFARKDKKILNIIFKLYGEIFKK